MKEPLPDSRFFFPAAPWPRSLKIISAIGTALILGCGIGAYRAIPVPSGFTRCFGLGLALIFPGIIAFSLLFVVTGYSLDGYDLLVHRLLWPTRISLSGLSRAYAEPAVCKGSIRIFGNGGLFAFTGLFYNPKLGRYRLFATDFTKTVVLVLQNRTLVVTPASPAEFTACLRLIAPGIAGDAG